MAEEQKIFTLDLLAQSKKEGRLLVGIEGEIFDVEKGKDFYGEGKTYHCFVGRDATRG